MLAAQASRRCSSARFAGSLSGVAVLACTIGVAGDAEVRVRERNGEAIKDLQLELVPAHQAAHPSYFVRRANALTGADGQARFSNLDAGSYAVLFGPLADPALLRPEDNPWAETPVITVPASGAPVAIEVELWRGVPTLLDVTSIDAELPRSKVVLRHAETGRIFEHPFSITIKTEHDHEAHMQRTLVEGRWQAQLDIPAGYLVLDLRVNGVSVEGGIAEIDTSLFEQRSVVEWDVSAPCEVWGRLDPESFGSTVVATLLEGGPWIEQEAARGRVHQRVEPQRWEPPSEYHLRLPPGAWRIAPEGEQLESSDPASVDLTLVAGDVRRQDFSLKGTEDDRAGLDVEVVEPDGRSGVSDALVAVYRVGRVGLEAPLQSGRTGESKWAPGRVRLSGLKPGEYDVVAGHPDWLDGRTRVSFAPSERNPHPTERVVLKEGATIQALARDEDGTLHTDIEILVRWIGEEYPSPLEDPALDEARLRRRKRTDLTGVAVVRGLPEGPWRVEAHAVGEHALEKFVRVAQGKGPALEQVDLEVLPPSRYDVRLEVRPGASIAGRLICDDRGPMPPAIAARTYVSTAPWDGIELGPGSEAVLLADVVETEPTVEPDALIDVERFPLEGRDLDRFTIGPLEQGSYVLAIRFEGYEGWAWGYGTDLRSEAAPLLLEAGQSLDLGSFEGRCAPAIVIRPQLDSREPIPDLRLGRFEVAIQARDATGEKVEVRPTVEARRGHLLVRGLLPSKADFKLRIEHPHLVPRTASWEARGVELDRGTHRVEHVSFVRVGGALVVANSSPGVAVRSGDSVPLVAPTEAGSASFEGLVPGLYSIAACLDSSCSSTAPTREVTVEAYRTLHVELGATASSVSDPEP